MYKVEKINDKVIDLASKLSKIAWDNSRPQFGSLESFLRVVSNPELIKRIDVTVDGFGTWGITINFNILNNHDFRECIYFCVGHDGATAINDNHCVVSIIKGNDFDKFVKLFDELLMELIGVNLSSFSREGR